MISSLPGLTGIKPGSVTCALPGVSAELFDDAGGEIEQGCGVPELTQRWPGMLRTLPQDPDRFVQTYFSRFGPRNYFVFDGARRDEGGYYWITRRTRFGKIVCRLLRDIAEGRNPGDAATLRDPSVLAKLQQATTQDDSESAGAPETGNTR
jgi:acyl-coenzyme A synthetase/AMP-(fatty) acid ligase